MVNVNEQLDQLIRNFSVNQGIDESTTAKFVIEVLQTELIYLGDKVSLSDGKMPLPFSQKYVITETEDYWHIYFKSEEGIFKKSIGMKYITLLLNNPYKSVNLIELMQMAGDQLGEGFDKDIIDIDLSLNDFGTFDPVMDRKYISDIKRQLNSLDPDFNQKEIDFLKKTLINACAPGGRVRGFRNNSLEKNRKRIGNAIHRAIDKIKNECPELSIHLLNSIRCGNNLMYIPEAPLVWNIYLCSNA